MSDNLWTDNAVPSQAGKVMIVTGATSGIGYETALALAKADASVVLASRNEAMGNMTLDKIRQIYPAAKVSFMCLDTGSQASARSFCDVWQKTGRKIDCLILNAGISNVPKREETEDGFERQLATNYLGHFTMTALLLPYMNNAARIIPVASLSHKRTHLHFDDLQLKQRYNPMTAYSQSKLAVLTFALELSRMLASNSSGIKVVPVHPGVAATDITRGGDRANPVIRCIAKTMFGVIGQSAAEGAWPTIYAVTSDDVQSGVYYGPGGAGERRGIPAPAKIAPQASDRENAERLWTISEELTQVKYRF